jgi:hypothetical protein
MDPQYIKKIQEWVQLDNKIIDIENKVKPLKDSITTIIEENKKLYESKSELEKEIIEYIHEHNMDKLTINTSDGNIKFSKRTNTQSLSMKVLRSILKGYEEENPDIQSEDIMNYIMNKLEKRSQLSIKRQIV